jgi:transcription elongation GreA/GreB family factor
LEDTRENWIPVHAAGASWVEEGAAPVGGVIGNLDTVQLQEARNLILETDENLEIQVGDIVRYVDIEKPDDTLSVQITNNVSELATGLVSVNTPLAQTLIGAVVMDEVTLHVPGMQRRVFRITGITRPA